MNIVLRLNNLTPSTHDKYSILRESKNLKGRSRERVCLSRLIRTAFFPTNLIRAQHLLGSRASKVSTIQTLLIVISQKNGETKTCLMLRPTFLPWFPEEFINWNTFLLKEALGNTKMRLLPPLHYCDDD